MEGPPHRPPAPPDPPGAPAPPAPAFSAPAATAPSPGKRRRVTPFRLLVVSAALYVVAVPLPWIEGTSSVGSVSFTGIEVFVFGICSVGAALTTLFGGTLLRRARRGAALFVTGVASACSMLFVLTAVVAIGAVKALVNAVVPDELATASVGAGIFVVFVAAVGSFAAVLWGLSQPDQLPEGAPLRRWLTLPGALIRAGRAHLRAEDGVASVPPPAGG